MTVRVADDVHVGLRHRLALANDLGRQRVLGLAGGDVRNRTKLDDPRRRAEGRVAVADERTPRGVGADGAVGARRVTGRAQADDARDSTCRLAETLLGNARDQSGANAHHVVLAEVVADA